MGKDKDFIHYQADKRRLLILVSALRSLQQADRHGLQGASGWRVRGGPDLPSVQACVLRHHQGGRQDGSQWTHEGSAGLHGGPGNQLFPVQYIVKQSLLKIIW